LLRQLVKMEHQDAPEDVNFGDDVINTLLSDDILTRALRDESAFVDAIDNRNDDVEKLYH